jgi:KUP system potassium uptake protein
VLHETVALLTIQVINDPMVDQDTRFEVQELATDFYRVVLRYGFMEEPDLMEDLKLCMLGDRPLFGDNTTFFMGRETIIPTAGTGMAIWREHLYAWMKRNAGSAIDFYHVPPARTIEIGGQYEM